MIQSLIASALLSFSIGAKSLPVTVPVTHDFLYESSEYVDVYSIYGIYNLRNSWDFSTLTRAFDYTIVFEEQGDGTTESPTYAYRCPFVTGNNDYQQLYLYNIRIACYFTPSNNFDYLDIEFNCYDLYANVFEHDLSIERGDTITDFPSIGGCMFYVHDSILLHDEIANIFNIVFTTDDNYYTTTYDGYYTLNDRITSIPSKICVLGSTLFNNQIGYGMTNYGYTDTVLAFYYYNFVENYYYLEPYNLPFNNKIISTKNILFSNVKMTKTTKTYLENVGIFAFTHDYTYDNADFQDLLFSIMDSPIYMITKLLNFELFGFNLYIALSGFLTIIIVCFLVRKFI